jgi:hypothetical protein
MLNLTRLHLGIAHESQFQGLGIRYGRRNFSQNLRRGTRQLAAADFGPPPPPSAWPIPIPLQTIIKATGIKGKNRLETGIKGINRANYDLGISSKLW